MYLLVWGVFGGRCRCEHPIGYKYHVTSRSAWEIQCGSSLVCRSCVSCANVLLSAREENTAP
eukprot:2826649-Amphidinium_carterae.1